LRSVSNVSNSKASWTVFSPDGVPALFLRFYWPFNSLVNLAAYVAAGRFDAYWESGIQPWDVAAGSVIVKEAGGFIAPFERGKDPVKDGSIIATNGEIHDKIVKILRG